MSGSYRVLFRKGREEEEDGEIELTNMRLDSEDGEVGVDSASDGELAQGTKEDRKSLIQEEEIDENGVVKDYEVALKHVGFGLFHVLLIAVNGVALMSDAVEVLSISFILPILRERGEFGVTDSQNVLLSSVIFIGMLFSSYCWGGFADVVGRRLVLLLSLTLNGLFGLLSAFSPNFSMFIICRFISGVGVGGSLPVIFPYIAEFTRNKYRGPYLGVQSFFWTFGRFLCGGLAWVILPQAVVNISLGSLTIHSWRVYIAVTAVPSLLGALLYFLLPESPRFLLETGKEKKALKALRLAHRLNHLKQRGKEFPVKRIQLDVGENSGESELRGSGCGQRLRVFTRQVRQVLSQTAELFHRHLLRRTILLLIILFCLSFGSYGVTLWYPSYVQLVTEQEQRSDFNTFCHRNSSSPALPDYCGCEGASFSGHSFSQLSLHSFKLSGAEFSNTVLTDVTVTQVALEDCSFRSCRFENVTFKSGSFRNVEWNGIIFNDVTFSDITFCNGSASDVEGGRGTQVDGEGVSSDGELVAVLVGGNASCDGVEVECEEETSDRVYMENFFIAGAALPGNIVSAIAVYLLRRNYWMAMSLFASTASVFVLYVVHSEVFVVVMLCVFTALSTPAWNDSGLLITELYPTHLRSTSMGIHLLSARVGAILGTNLFGLFIHVNPSIPILLVACVLLAGSLASLPLPKTTRKTHLQ